MGFHAFDLHVHTFFSDGQIDLDAQFELLHQNKIEIVGFADHIHPGSGCFSKERLEYRKSLLRLYERKYRKYGIRVLIGGEVDILEAGHITLPRGITPEHFDYLQVSKHHTLPKQIPMMQKKPNWDKWLWAHDLGLILNKMIWIKEIHNCFKCSAPDILAHPTWNMPGYMTDAEIKRLVWLAWKYGVALELNPNNRSHWASKNERTRVLKIFSKYRHLLRFSLGSDFHGFKKEKLWEMGLSQEMYEEAIQYGLKLIDPHDFLPEHRSEYLNIRKKRIERNLNITI